MSRGTRFLRFGALFFSAATTASFIHSPSMSLPKDHHHGSGFRNPWPSFKPHSISQMFSMITTTKFGKAREGISPTTVPETVRPMNWDLIRNPEQATDGIVATWLGHACVLVQFNGFNVLLDPIFSHSCAPVSFLSSFHRYTDPPCDLTELPRIDAIVISHNHYDHLDGPTLRKLAEANPDAKIFVPLGNKPWFNFATDRVEELDWWDSSVIQHGNKSLRLTCTPCQHFSGRTPFDRNKTLWASWALEGIVDNESKHRVYFGGDTGYRTVPKNATPEEQHDEAYLEKLPHCPAFKEIGDKLGPFDLAFIPIGAYSPRFFMSAIHLSPEDAVRVHEDVKSKKSIGIHWGTFVLTDEPVNEPPVRLRAALKNRGHSDQEFVVLKLGETDIVTPSKL